MIDTAKYFTIERDFAASPERVWAAWFDPKQMSAWFHPRGVSTPASSISVDARVGGRYAYTMVVDATGEEFPTAGEYLRIEEPHLLSFTWGTPGDSADEAPRVTVELIENADGGTRMLFTCQGIANDSGTDASAHDGWASALDLLAEHLGLRV